MKHLKEELKKEKAERKRLEGILLDTYRFRLCTKCNTAQRTDDLITCRGKCMEFNDACDQCIDLTGWHTCINCHFLYCPKCHHDFIILCDVRGCNRGFCCGPDMRTDCIVKHYTCCWHKNGFGWCFPCTLIRRKNAQHSLSAALISLKRNCHKDIYINIYIPILKEIYTTTFDKAIWD